MDCDGAIRNIEKEILRECAYKNIQVNENFMVYYIKLLALDPKWGISTNFMSNRTDVQNFIKFVVSQMQDLDTPQMIALKMQMYFACNFRNKYQMVKRNREELMKKLKPIRSQIMEMKKPKNEDEVASLYRKIVIYVTLASGLGNPMMEPVFKEGNAALRSILDEKEIVEFMAQPKYEKEENLAEFTQLVTGIRLFNKDCSKGGEGMEDLPKLLNLALEASNADFEKVLLAVIDKVNLLTTALHSIYSIELDERGYYIVVCNNPEIDPASIEYVKQGLVIYRQCEIFMRKLIEEVDQVEIKSHQIYNDLKLVLVELHQVVQHRIAIPVEQVFPLFSKLADTWFKLQDESVLLAKLNQIAQNLQQYLKLLHLKDSVAEMMIPAGEMPVSDAERFERSSQGSSRSGEPYTLVDTKIQIPSIRSEDPSITSYRNTRLTLKTVQSSDQLNYEYLGFCGWMLVATDGALIPGNPLIGYGRVMNRNFVFASTETAVAFFKSPEKYIMEIIQLARRKPEYINLLQIQEELNLVREIKELVREPPPLPLTNECEVQTDTHAAGAFNDRSYYWNIWDLKRQAMQLANLVNCKTVSVQTQKSTHRKAARTQTYDSKEVTVQTKTDNYSNTPIPSNYLFGLRGRKDDKQLIVELTRPVKE